nr:MAG TPA: hypothetical protein [Caudoviricetes sp.]
MQILFRKIKLLVIYSSRYLKMVTIMLIIN